MGHLRGARWRRRDDAACARQGLEDLTVGRETVHFGHHQVHANDVRTQALGEFKGNDTVLRLTDDIVITTAQNAAQQRPDHVIVIDDQHSRLI